MLMPDTTMRSKPSRYKTMKRRALPLHWTAWPYCAVQRPYAAVRYLATPVQCYLRHASRSLCHTERAMRRLSLALFALLLLRLTLRYTAWPCHCCT